MRKGGLPEAQWKGEKQFLSEEEKIKEELLGPRPRPKAALWVECA